MIAVIQRVTSSKVIVADKIIGQIEQGIMALIGVEKSDDQQNIDKLLHKLLNYRIFSDQDDKMNWSLQTLLEANPKAGLLLVPQFTLAADTQSGMRPSFSKAAPPAHGKTMFESLLEQAKHKFPNVQSGEFGANMQVHLVNDGPVTFRFQL